MKKNIPKVLWKVIGDKDREGESDSSSQGKLSLMAISFWSLPSGAVYFLFSAERIHFKV